MTTATYSSSGLTPRGTDTLSSEALRIITMVRERIGESRAPDAQRVLATAEVYEAVALGKLGHFRAAARALDALSKSGRPEIIQALNGLARQVADEDSAFSELGALSLLYQRAQALGQGDTHITRIAYEESLRPDVGVEPRSPLGRLLARFYQAGKGKSH